VIGTLLSKFSRFDCPFSSRTDCADSYPDQIKQNDVEKALNALFEGEDLSKEEVRSGWVAMLEPYADSIRPL